jgi:7-carboxy-7-deazaguanine synthase
LFRAKIFFQFELEGGRVKINEIFYSLQGESSFVGCPCAFIRLSACDLRCRYCDTEYAFYEGKEMSIPDIIEAIAGYPTRLALVTGGEPLLQRSVHELFRALLERNYTVCLETAGHIPVRDVDPRVHKIMDLKCPSSGMMSRNDYGNVEYLTRGDEVKFVIGNRADFDWACEITRGHHLTSRTGAVLFSPVYGTLAYADLARWILESGIPVRMQIQLHKVIWPDSRRGV